MKVMVCYYFFERAISLGNDIAEGFESLGHTVCRFDSTITPRFGRVWKLAKSLGKLFGQKARVARWHEQRLNDGLSERFRVAAEVFRPELIVVIQGERIAAQVVQRVSRDLGAKSVLWWVKPPRWQASIFEDRPFYDAVFTIDGSVTDEGIGHLPSWGLNPKLFYPGRFEDKTRELLFVGSWSEHRQRYLEAIADLPLRVVGSGWGKRLPASHPLRARLAGTWIGGSDLADAYRKAWAVVDIPQFEQTEGQGVNMRFADVPACGTVLITRESHETQAWYGEAGLVTYCDKKSFKAVSRRVVADEKTVYGLSQAGALTAVTLPTFIDRAKIFCEVCCGN